MTGTMGEARLVASRKWTPQSPAVGLGQQPPGVGAEGVRRLLQDAAADRGIVDGGQLASQPPSGLLGAGGEQVGREVVEVLPGLVQFGAQQLDEVVPG
ncbi:hypothetical protein [Nonomuraea dietziae]|uniref:hypothetical protein n=1 Tax=Nonomuraea dietziae TaxID=65515 RepID=UPI0031CFF15C